MSLERADDSPPTGPLRGLRVFDWTFYALGPFAGMLLGALGADVIKIEEPAGDPQLRERGKQRGMATYYMNLNLNKRSVTLDVRRPQDRAKALELAAACDIFLNNMRPGTPERLGLGYDVISKIRPDIVYCVATGWGSSGPMANLGGVDVLAQAFGGQGSITGKPGGRPELSRQLGCLDLTGSAYVVGAILQALVVRARTGEGQRIEVSLLGSTLTAQSTRLAEYFATGQAVPRLGSASGVAVPDQAFLCQDRQYLAVTVVDDGQWRRLCMALGQPSLCEDPRFQSNADRVAHREELVRTLAAIFGTRPVSWWDLQLNRHRVPHSRFWDFAHIRYHPQILENGFLTEVDTGTWGKLLAGGVPWRFSETPATLRRNPRPGEHTEEVLTSLPGSARAVAPKAGAVRDQERAAGSGVATKAGAALADLRVLDLTEGIAGPFAAQLLGDGGATVFKLEPPSGDYARQLGPPWVGEESALFVSLNRNKRFVRLESQDADAREKAIELAGEADVVLVDSVGPDGRPPLVSYDEVAAINPTAIYCSVSPLGEAGPLASLPGSELVVQAMGNVWQGLGVIGEEPMRLGTDFASTNTGLAAFQGILAALYWRARGGGGQRVGVSLLGTLFSLKSHNWGSLGDPDDWEGIVHQGLVNPPNYGYRTADGAIYFAFYRCPDDEFRQLLQEVGMPPEVMADPRFQEGAWATSAAGKYASEVRTVWEQAFADKTTAELLDLFGRYQAYAVPINDYPALVRHPQVASIDILDQIELPGGRKFTVVRPPWRFSRLPACVPPRWLGDGGAEPYPHPMGGAKLGDTPTPPVSDGSPGGEHNPAPPPRRGAVSMVEPAAEFRPTAFSGGGTERHGQAISSPVEPCPRGCNACGRLADSL